ncbi:MAG TPA: 50S ribosomal protein L10 [Chlamydiales bacterium]|nr:50S ribosomal protein L10 [Chlamydiales bacterium]
MRKEKQFLLDEIQENIEGAKALLIAKYGNIEPNMSWKFRSQLANAGASFQIVKKRVLQKAAEKCGIAISSDALQGNIGVVYSEKDPLEATKLVYKFAEENEVAALEILVGHIEGKLYSAKDVKALSELPSMPEMRAQFLGLLEAPMSQTLSVIQSLLTSVMYCLENKSQTEEVK